jgi:hypothetical protein
MDCEIPPSRLSPQSAQVVCSSGMSGTADPWKVQENLLGGGLAGAVGSAVIAGDGGTTGTTAGGAGTGGVGRGGDDDAAARAAMGRTPKVADSCDCCTPPADPHYIYQTDAHGCQPLAARPRSPGERLLSWDCLSEILEFQFHCMPHTCGRRTGLTRGAGKVSKDSDAAGPQGRDAGDVQLVGLLAWRAKQEGRLHPQVASPSST